MQSSRRSALLLAGAVVWAAWVLAHYYDWPLTRPELADGVRGAAFPYWREAVREAGRAVGGAGLALWSAFGFGAVLLRVVARVGRHRAGPIFDSVAERVSFRLAGGIAALSVACLGLALVHAYRPLPLYALTMVGIALAVREAGRSWRERSPSRWAPPRLPRDAALPLLCLGGAIGCAFVAAIAPEIEYDALWYHLWLPQQWLGAGRAVDVVHEYVSLYPLFWQLVYGLAMTLGGPGAAKLVHFACLPLVGTAAWLLTRRLFPGANAWLAAALAVVSPTVIWEGTTAYNDLALAWYLSLSVHALLRHDADSDTRWLVLAAVMLGSALAIKHLALLACVAIAAVVMLRALTARSDLRGTIRAAAAFSAIALAIPAPWYARAYAHSGNPVFPELYQLFGARPPERWSPATDAGLARFKARFGPPRTVRGLATLPWDMTVHGARYGGTLGPLFLILVPWAFARPMAGRARFVATGAVVYLALWASPASSFQMRFVVPLVPLLAVFGAAGAATLGTAAAHVLPRGAAAVVFGTCALLLTNLPPFTRWHEPDRVGDQGWLTHVVRVLPARVALGSVSRGEYLGNFMSSYVAWNYINQALPEQARILTFSGGDHLYSMRDRLWSDATLAHPITWGAASGAEQQVRARAQELRITHVLFDKRQVARGELADLAIASAAMHDCCLRLVYEDPRFGLYQLSNQPGR